MSDAQHTLRAAVEALKTRDPSDPRIDRFELAIEDHSRRLDDFDCDGTACVSVQEARLILREGS